MAEELSIISGERKKNVGNFVIKIIKPYFNQDVYQLAIMDKNNPSNLYESGEMDGFQAKNFYDGIDSVGKVKQFIVNQG